MHDDDYGGQPMASGVLGEADSFETLIRWNISCP